jgi:hypothetical protein
MGSTSMMLQITQSAQAQGSAAMNLSNYSVNIFMAASVSTQALCDSLEQTRINAEVSLGTIVTKLKEEAADTDISVGRTFISLNCPLSQSRIKLPCAVFAC